MKDEMNMRSLCGIDCNGCFLKNDCKGCEKTGGAPFGRACLAAKCLKNGGCLAKIKQTLMDEVNALSIVDMDEVTEINLLKGSFINIEYTLPNGTTMKLWDDDGIYFGTQMPKKRTARCYGIAADERYIAVSEYGENGADAELVVLVKRKGEQG